MWKLRAILAALCVAVLLSGCCSLVHSDRLGRPSSERGEWDWPLHIFGNALLGGVIGFTIDLITGAAWRDKEVGGVLRLDDGGGESLTGAPSYEELKRRWRKAKSKRW